MEKTLHQLTVLMASGCIGMILLSSYLAKSDRTSLVELGQMVEFNQQMSK